MILVAGLLTDWMPDMYISELFIEALRLDDTLLAAVFGGILNAAATALCLHADATSGGTDFIAIAFSERYRRDAWNYIFAGNCVILTLAGFLFSLDKALYSIIFQFATTEALKAFYKDYQKQTLFIITQKPDEVYHLIRDLTQHAATSFEGVGNYDKQRRVMLYSVVSASEARRLISAIKRVDPGAFINVLKTEQVNGKIYQRPRD